MMEVKIGEMDLTHNLNLNLRLMFIYFLLVV
jgi:hypothetical protein